MKEQVSNIVVAIIISGTILYSVGAFHKDELTYATVHFDGGFKKLGVLAEQRAYSDFEVTMGDNTIFSGNIDKVVSEIEDSIATSENKNVVIWTDGVRIKGSVGVSWIGSESNFKLTTDTLDKTSYEDNPIIVTEIISELKAMDYDIKQSYMQHANDALTFSREPESSFLLSKLISTLG